MRPLTTTSPSDPPPAGAAVTGRYFIKTYGCQMNEYDSSRMGDVLAAAEGFVATDDPAVADVLIVNTCSVREKAESKVFSLLGEWKQIKDARPGVIIGVGGCVASQEGDTLIKAAPQVDLVFGPQTVHRLPQMLAELRGTGRPVVDVSFPEIEKFDALPAPRAEGATAFVSIMEGCSKYCSFCVVPYTRGDEVSRPLESVLAEVAQLAAQGVREVTLLGQNVNAYRGAMADGVLVDLATLLHHVAAIAGIERIRFTTSHPLEFDDSLIEAYANIPKLANHLHLPVQSGSDRVLALMKRGYTALEFKEKIRKLRAVRPDISVTSDFIVGFPGESARDFQATLQLVRDLSIDQSFSFLYSRRPGTPAASLPDDTPQEEKQAPSSLYASFLSNRPTMSVWRICADRSMKTCVSSSRVSVWRCVVAAARFVCRAPRRARPRPCLGSSSVLHAPRTSPLRRCIWRCAIRMPAPHRRVLHRRVTRKTRG
ncbi:MAG: tRNA (N6-isopentenyl adenosine(37)-C2)-methylthiotransferase MiaB [Gammaproteobacteria bacterium]|nr:tRNA (N6-isopentenyl adenosine(37)-C2)-methylthiotransferase MiaB [Gammaproteobacteria bacterium]